MDKKKFKMAGLPEKGFLLIFLDEVDFSDGPLGYTYILP